MTQRETEVSFRHMLDAIQEAIDLAEGKSLSDLEADRMLNLSLVRLLEIVGEAANRVPQSEQKLHPEIPWPAIISLRNRLIHGYDDVDLDIVWEIVTDSLPPLVEQLTKILSSK